jgi:HD-like signal output (HDOD) protein
MKREEILQRLQGDVSLPALPEVLLRLDRILKDPEVDIKEVARLASTDAVLSGQIIRMSNSAYYARGGTPLNSLQPAIQRMGLRALRGLVFALTLPRIFQEGRDGFPYKALWRHSLAVSAFAAELVTDIGGSASQREDAWLGGLVHDIGSLVLASLYPMEYGKLLSDTRTELENQHEWDDRQFADREKDVFGIDHAEIGGLFLKERWRLPHPIPDIARYHHTLGWEEPLPYGVERSTIMVVHLANGICSHYGIGWNPAEQDGKAFQESAWEAIGLTLDRVETLLAKVKTSLGVAETMLSGGD